MPAPSLQCASSTWLDLPGTTEVEYGFYTPVIFGRLELAETEWWRQLPSQRSQGGKNQAPLERVRLWKKETKKHKMNHWKSIGRKARRWDLELRGRFQLGLVKWKTDMRLRTSLFVSFTQTLAVFTLGTGLDTQLLPTEGQWHWQILFNGSIIWS